MAQRGGLGGRIQQTDFWPRKIAKTSDKTAPAACLLRALRSF
jgi:hypothetical protein